jgi:hypothetical protein
MKADKIRTAANFAAAGKKTLSFTQSSINTPVTLIASHSNALVYPCRLTGCRHCRAFTSPPEYERQETGRPVRSCLLLQEVIKKFLIVELVRFFRAARTRLFMIINSKNKALRPSPPAPTQLTCSSPSHHNTRKCCYATVFEHLPPAKLASILPSNRCNITVSQESELGGKIPVEEKIREPINTGPQRKTGCQNQVGHSYDNNLIVE